jgi:hypothetical protein
MCRGDEEMLNSGLWTNLSSSSVTPQLSTHSKFFCKLSMGDFDAYKLARKNISSIYLCIKACLVASQMNGLISWQGDEAREEFLPEN